MSSKTSDTPINNQVIDAKKAIFDKIFAENQELRDKLSQIMEISRENEDRQHHYNKLEEAIFAADNLSQLITSLQHELIERFHIPLVTVALLDSILERIEDTPLPATKTTTRMRPLTSISKGIYQNFFPQHQPLISSGLLPELAEFFQASKKSKLEIGSSACIPLKAGSRLMGILMLASNDKKKFNPSLATDFVERLSSRLAIAIENLTIRNQLEKVSLTDQLTGLYNRRSLAELMPLEFERAKRYDHQLSILMIDLDDFKQINDQYGHGAGDLILSNLGKILIDNTRRNDAVVRYGGDEFLVIMPHTDGEQARVVADKILEKTRERSISLSETTKISCSLSLGLATFPAAGIETSEALLNQADQNLYTAKKEGKGKIKG
ncbi:MAG: sensor domain-containing diguanylate cyclase [Pseudomonadota bacterium]|nr:sensor domain-containing diguanylate cyclase [Pseudomonadota bacterium]